MGISMIHSFEGILGKVKNVLRNKSGNQEQQEIFESPTLGKVELLGLSEGAYNYYKTKVKNNADEDLYTARKKITRNALTGVEIKNRNENLRQIAYGNLTLYLQKDNNEVIYIRNYKKLNGKLFIPKYKIDFKLKNELNQVFGLK